MKFVNEILIHSTVSKVTEALANSEQSKEYYYGFEIHSDFQKDSPYEYKIGDMLCIHGIIKEVVPGSKIVMTFNGNWSPKVAEHPETIVTWELEQVGVNAFVRLTHDGLNPGTYAAESLPRGWVNIVSSLKTYLETGKGLEIDMSMMN